MVFVNLYYQFVELQGSYGMALDELLLRSIHSIAQARAVTTAARSKRKGVDATCNNLMFASCDS